MEPEESELEECFEELEEEAPAAEIDSEAETDFGPNTSTETETAIAEAPEESAALEEGLRLLDNSQKLIRTVFLGLALQYRSLDLQRCQLLAQAENPEAASCGLQPRAVQAAASLITLCALFGFQKQAQELVCQTAQAGGCPDTMDVKLGAVIILVALIRLIRLTRPECPPSGEEAQLSPQEEEAEELVELEELTEPVI